MDEYYLFATAFVMTHPNDLPKQGNVFDESKLEKRGLSPTEETIILVLFGAELYGNQIQSAVESVSQGKRKMALGTLHPTLAKLEDKKLVRSRWATGSKRVQGGRRRLYRLTAAGEQAIETSFGYRAALLNWRPDSDE